MSNCNMHDRPDSPLQGGPGVAGEAKADSGKGPSRPEPNTAPNDPYKGFTDSDCGLHVDKLE